MESVLRNRAWPASVTCIGMVLPNNACRRTHQKRRAAEGERWVSFKHYDQSCLPVLQGRKHHLLAGSAPVRKVETPDLVFHLRHAGRRLWRTGLVDVTTARQWADGHAVWPAFTRRRTRGDDLAAWV